MITSKTPACVISGTSSGSGKTTVTLGLMAALNKKGLQVQPFKCGPDFIDPGLHQLVTGKISRNLDLWMAGTDFSVHSFHANSHNSDVAIIEGVMGMYDGDFSSSATLSEYLNLPNFLVLDVRSMAQSAAAIVKGFQMLNPNANLTGVILNRIASQRHLQLVSTAIKEHCDVEVLGYLPRTEGFAIPSRHLGLLTADDAPLSNDAVNLLADTVSEHIDLDNFLSYCSQTTTLNSFKIHHQQSQGIRIGVARDRAFCFYYEDNFDLLREAGAELVFFSPITDKRLPSNLHCLYLGGGYPELYCKELSENEEMLSDIRQWINSDRPIYAECGGFMYLTLGIEDTDKEFHPLVGCFPVRSRMKSKRVSLGYREVLTVAPSFFGPAETTMRGHEFHYSDIDKMPDSIERLYRVGESGQEGYRHRNVIGGYMHLHFGYNPEVVTNLLNNFK